jgi:SAM-dependent methyltransferase
LTDTPLSPPDAKRHAPATLRNREPIRAVLESVLPRAGRVIEIGAGTGEHAIHLAAAFPQLDWLPTDPDPEALASIAAWARESPLPNLLPPARLDARQHPWPVTAGGDIEAVICINMIHIAPWEACLGLLAGAGHALRPAGVLFLYGPFMRDGRHTAPSNAAFDESLKRMDPRFGVRDLAQVTAAAAACGLVAVREVAMPANNLAIVFRRQGDPHRAFPEN